MFESLNNLDKTYTADTNFLAPSDRIHFFYLEP